MWRRTTRRRFAFFSSAKRETESERESQAAFTQDAACAAPAAGFSAALQIQGDLRYAGQSEVGGVFKIFSWSSIRLFGCPVSIGRAGKRHSQKLNYFELWPRRARAATNRPRAAQAIEMTGFHSAALSVSCVKAALHTMQNWRATYKQYSLLHFPVKITEFLWNSSAFKNCRVFQVVGGANAQTTISLVGAHLLSSLFWFQQISSSQCRQSD